jgi:hypothetical protein
MADFTRLRLGHLLGLTATLALTLIACGGGSDGGDGDAGGDGDGDSAGDGDGDGDFLGSCDVRDSVEETLTGRCRDWYGEPGADLEVSCDGLEGEYSPSSPCPNDSRVGRCQLAPVLGMTAFYNYHDSDWTAESVQQHCEQTGAVTSGEPTWIPEE